MVRIGDAFLLVGGGTPSTAIESYWGAGTPWFSSADIDSSGKISFRRRVTDDGINNSTTNIVSKNTVVVVTRVGLGKVAKIKEDMCFSQDIQALIPKNGIEIDADYLCYQMRCHMQSMKYRGQGTTISGITKKQLSDVEILLPNYTEQRRTVAYIEELLSKLDNGVETLRKTKQQLAVYRQAVLKEAFDKAGEKQVPLRGIIEKPRYGTSKKCSYDIDEHSLPVYRIPNINYFQGTISHDDLKYASFTEDEFDSLKLRSGDILIIRSNGSVSLVGRSAIVAEEDTYGLFAGYLMRLRIKAKAEILPKYLNLYLNTHYARYQIEQMAKSTSGVNNINSDEICRICLPVCDIDLQKEIIQEIEARLSVCDSIEKTVDIALQQTEAMRQSILKRAFEGRL